MYLVFKRLPIEWYAIALPLLILFLFFRLVEPAAFSRSGSTFETFLSLAFSFLGFFTITVLLYVLYRTVRWSARLIKRSITDMFVSHSGGVTLSVKRETLASAGMICLLLGSIFYLHASLMEMLLYSHSAQEVALFSAYFTQLDSSLLGEGGIANLLRFSNQYPLFQSVAAVAYDLLVFISGTVLMLSFLHSIKLFRTFLIGFFLLFILAIPLWYTMPAVSPTQFLLEGVTGEVISEPLQVVAIKLDQELPMTTATYQTVYARLVDAWQGKMLVLNQEQEFAITTNPSLHVALGILCVYFAWRMSWLLGVVLTVYQAINMFATMLLLQHYVIDIPFGVLVGVLAVLIARQALLFEAEYMQVQTKKEFYLLERCRKDLVRFFQLFIPSQFFRSDISAADKIR